LLERAKEKFSEGLPVDKYLIAESIMETISEREFSDKVDDEAATLKLTLSLDVEAISVGKDFLIELAKKELGDKVPSGFVLRDEQIDIDFEFEEEEDGYYTLITSISVNLLPEVKPDEIAKKIAGKYPLIAKEYLTDDVPGFVRAEINFKPKLPGRLGTLPRLAKNIEVEIAAEK
jgi:hypothetical protein